MHHIWGFFDTTYWPNVVKKIASVGYLGVDIFFVISGFLITGLLIEKIADDKIDITRFYKRRFFKIYPQYFFAVIIGYFFYSLYNPFNIIGSSENPSIISYIFFFQNYQLQLIPLLSHTWSLAIEMHFYILFPFLVVITCLIYKDLRKRRMFLVLICVCLIVLFNAIRYFWNDIDFLSEIFKVPRPFQTTFFRADAIIFGCLLKLSEPYYYNLKEKLWKLILQASRMVGIYIFTIFVFLGFNQMSWYSYSLAYIGAGILLLPHKNLIFMRFFFENKFLEWIGKNSYGLFIWHYLLIWPFSIIGKQYGQIMIFMYIIITILVGVASTLFIEQFFLNLRSRVSP